MTEHKATLGQWNVDRYDWAHADTEALDGDPAFRCIIELRSRVEALEAAAKPAESNRSAEPDSSLVERVADDIAETFAPYVTADKPARAVILAVADWLDQQELHSAAKRLRQEVGE